jgi:polysaccharide deacetylase 2 family uncharacterized protein YibQ
MQTFRSQIKTKSDRFLKNKEEMTALVKQLDAHMALSRKEGNEASISRARKRKNF